jgi:hypothetical protein
MNIVLNHTIVPVRDKRRSAQRQRAGWWSAGVLQAGRYAVHGQQQETLKCIGLRPAFSRPYFG